MKFLKKTLAVAVSLALCGSMVAPAFAASFSELNEAISSEESGTFGENNDIYASTGDDGTRNVQLNGDVTYAGEDDDTTITIDSDVTIDLNGQEINGGYVKDENEGSKDSVITVENGGNLTIKDTSEEQSGKITGGNASLGDAIENNAGGGVYVDEGSLTLESGSITDNYAGKNGGGVYVGKDGSFTMNGGTIANNATENYGGGVYLNTEWSAQNNGESKFVMNGGEISGNTVGSIEQGNGGGGGIGAVTYVENQDHTQGYDSIVINGGTIKNNTAGLQGGGIAVTNGTVKINGEDGNVVISGNTAGSHGGGIHSFDSKTEITGAVISGNKTTNTDEKDKAVGAGGGIFASSGSDLDVTSSTISGNTAATNGGGIYAQKAGTTVDVIDSTISGNSATTAGGGINVRDSVKANVSDSTISGNTAANGGGVAGFTSTITINGGTIGGDTADSANTATTGGGIYAQNAGTNVTVNGTNITGNTATGFGGGVRLYNGAQFTMNDGVITDNSGTVGGGIFNDGATVVVEKGSLYGNTATTHSTDLYSRNAALKDGTVVTGVVTLKDVNGQKLEMEDGTPITGWLWDGSPRWNANSDENKKYSFDHFTNYRGTLCLIAAHDKYYEVSYMDGDTVLQSSTWEKGEKVPGFDGENPTRPGYTFAGWLVDGENFDPATGTVTGTLTLVANWTENPPEPDPTDPVDPAGPDIEVEDPDVPLGGEPADDPTIEIDDPAVPLSSGPVTRAEFVDYLWRHEGEPAPVSDNGLFEDVTVEHEYSPAIAWAKSIGIIEAYEDGTFEPDELVTVAAVREILTRFAAYADMVMPELTTLTGGDGEAVLNCGQVLAEFFGESYEVPGMEDDAA